MLVLPVWLAIDETRDRTLPMTHVLAWTALAAVADTALLALLRAFVAPHLTTIVDGAGALAPGGCLGR